MKEKIVHKTLKQMKYEWKDELVNELYGENFYLIEEYNKHIEVLDKIKEYLTSYESINTIQECEIPENNIGLDEETFIEMVNRYMKVHDKILEILEEIE